MYAPTKKFVPLSFPTCAGGTLLAVALAGCSEAAELTSPPTDISREYAEQLISENPLTPNDGIVIDNNLLSCFVSEGYIENWRGLTNFRPTQFGSKYLSSVGFPGISNSGYIKAANPVSFQDIEISGIRSPQENVRVIEFTARHMLNGMEEETRCLIPIHDASRTAVAERYDDGWRITHSVARER